MTSARYLPDKPLPPYSYVPGMHPHPESDPRGHAHGKPREELSITEAQSWWTSKQWLFGFDLFNHGFYWEAHESWEQVWNAVGRTGPQADLVKGLIKLAAAGVKAREGKPAGVRRHARRAVQLLSQSQTAIGASTIVAWINVAEEVDRDAEGFINTSEFPVVIVFPFGLRADEGKVAD